MGRNTAKSTLLNKKNLLSKTDDKTQTSLFTDLSIKSHMPFMQSLVVQQHLETIRELQLKCIHENTIWLHESWTFGHYSGYEIQYCEICGKKLERKKIEDDGKW